VTWGCGYTAPSARMQYTGTSFSLQLAEVFQAILPLLRREKLPRGPFPQGTGHLNTHSVDAVERRMFEAVGEGDGLIDRLAARIPADPGFAFGAGLAVLVLAMWVLVGGGAR